MSKQSGFTLVELMVVVAIVAILATVAAPAYINYINRGRQTSAVEAVLRAKMDQQTFWADNSRYASTIGALSSFGNNPAKTADTSSGYTVTISGTQARAVRWISAAGTNDRVTINVTNDTAQPVIANPNALKFSMFSWIFK
jgi:type IV pilus assembly protein PilE